MAKKPKKSAATHSPAKTKRTRGRPKGSKDGPRPSDAPPRGRPKMGSKKTQATSDPEKPQASMAPEREAGNDDEWEDEYDGLYPALDLSEEDHRTLDEVEQRVGQSHGGTGVSTPFHEAMAPESGSEGCLRGDQPSWRAQLDEAVKSSGNQPFFSSKNTSFEEVEDDPDDEPDAGDADSMPAPPGPSTLNEDDGKPWFRQPVYMSDWLYAFFGSTVKSVLRGRKKTGKFLSRPYSFEGNKTWSPASMWLHPPDPCFALSKHNFNVTALMRPRIFLWLPHFFVEVVCPRCSGKLEKNGPTPPRRIIDIEDHFYIISWQYYCRDGCRSYFSGWSQLLLDSIARYMPLSFPAVLSRKGGVSNQVATLLRVGNQHKMGPAGIRKLLIELHTLRYNRIFLQYQEAALELVMNQETEPDGSEQTTIHAYMATHLAGFGHFSARQGYGGFVPSEYYLTGILNRAIERDEEDANQHTALLGRCDKIAIDDSYKIVGHLAKSHNISAFTALFTGMDSRYIRVQALTHTQAHDERLGPLVATSNSLKKYGYPEPPVAYTDNPIKDKNMLGRAFPTLTKNLTPIAAAYGLKPMVQPSHILTLESPAVIEGTLSSLVAPLDETSTTSLVVGFDAEWNVSRTSGVSTIQISPDSQPDTVYIIPVHKLNGHLPPSLLRILISPKVYKVGSAIKADFTRLKSQFKQLAEQKSFNVVDLKVYCTKQGVIERGRPGSLDILVEKLLGCYLSKDNSLRCCEEWESAVLRQDLLLYAALDAYASRMVFEEARKRTPPDRITGKTPPGTRVTLYTPDGRLPAAHGTISNPQLDRLGRIPIKVPTESRLLVDIDHVLLPSLGTTLHRLPAGRISANKAGTYSLQQLQSASMSATGTFQMVAHIDELRIYDSPLSRPSSPTPTAPSSAESAGATLHPDNSDRAAGIDEALDENGAGDAYIMGHEDSDDSDSEELSMLEAFSATAPLGEDLIPLDAQPVDPTIPDTVKHLQEIVAAPPDANSVFTRIKKDPFHGFHGLPLSKTHGATVPFIRTLRDHLLRWDPEARKQVDEVCRRVFKSSFDAMLLRNPRWVAERVPRYIPPPSVLVAAIEHVYSVFANARDGKTNEVLFTPAVWDKAKALLELARQGYYSDLPDVPLYEKAGVDQYGLQKWRCLRGTNNVEGGPHGDIYRKFGALNAGPRFATNCLQDHRGWYNAQAQALHEFGCDWDFHHNFGMINRTAFLARVLSDVMPGAELFEDWVIGDLYEKTEERFGICPFPESLRIEYCMEPYTESTRLKFQKLSLNDDWQRKKEQLALPILPPTTPEARHFFFQLYRKYSLAASNTTGKKNKWHSVPTLLLTEELHRVFSVLDAPATVATGCFLGVLDSVATEGGRYRVAGVAT
ncbi:hypothetical protein NMY22_g16549 [Coprinellus aureogranulatus]|nr:hypothetical protein NMY22_g16549 [Coprinellus aureogranulatus]